VQHGQDRPIAWPTTQNRPGFPIGIAARNATTYVASPHDSLFRRTFADPANAAAMFQCALPEALAAAIDWQTLTQLSNTLTDEELRKHFLDDLFTVRLREHDLWLVLQPEHKSRADRGLVLQHLHYSLHFWLKWAGEHPRADGLPPILPVLFHHGGEPWDGPTSLRDHFDLAGLAKVRADDPVLADLIAAHSVALRASVLDLARHDEEWLRSAPFPPLAKLTVLCLGFVRFQVPAEGLATLERWRDLLASLQGAPWGQLGFAGLESYLLHVTELTPEQLHTMFRRSLGTHDEFVSTAERLRREGQQAGEAIGKELGKEQGRELGFTQHAAETLRRLLQRRFGELPTTVQQRIAAATVAELDQWTDRLLDATTIADVFA
jgi:predicted transposase YdaD